MGIASIFLAGHPTLFAAGPWRGDDHFADIGAAPEVELIDQQGQPFRLSSLRGKAALVGFVFTTCSGTCPATTHRMSLAQEALRKAGLWGERVEFVSISLDPSRDKPEVLSQYASLYGADLAAWHFLTGEPDQIARILPQWDMWARPDAKGSIDHPSRIFLLDPGGRIREIYSLEFLNPEGIVSDVRAVLGKDG